MADPVMLRSQSSLVGPQPSFVPPWPVQARVPRGAARAATELLVQDIRVASLASDSGARSSCAKLSLVAGISALVVALSPRRRARRKRGRLLQSCQVTPRDWSCTSFPGEAVRLGTVSSSFLPSSRQVTRRLEQLAVPLSASSSSYTHASSEVADVELGDQKASDQFFFAAWADHLQELLVRSLNLVEEPIPPHLARRRGRGEDGGEGQDTTEQRGKAEVISRVFVGKGDEASPVRRLRITLVRNGPLLQAFNAVAYPAYHLGPLPILGIDVLSFNNHQRMLFGTDWAPMSQDDVYLATHITKHLEEVRARNADIRADPSARFYGEAPEFFSPQLFFSRPDGPEALHPGARLWKVFEEYSLRYVDMLLAAVSSASIVSAQVPGLETSRQRDYDLWHAERDPALPIFRRLFGAEWTAEYVSSVLFPGAQQASHPDRNDGRSSA